MSLFNMSAVKNHPRRSGFDLSNRVCFTSKAGELLPVFWDIVYPGDSFKIKTQLFTRTQPLNTAAYTRIREYLDFYFVPLRLINKNLPTALMQMQDNPVQATGLSSNKIVTTDIPWLPVNAPSTYGSLTALTDVKKSFSSSPVENLLGFDAIAQSAKLLMYLRYGNFLSSVVTDEYKSLGLSASLDLRNSETVSTGFSSMHILPLAAYQKAYADFFRFTQWEKNQPYTYNFDWYSGGNILASLSTLDLAKKYYSDDNLFTLRYANWPKDMFMGVMPDSQLGDVSIVDASGSEGTFPVGLLDTNDGTLRAGLLARSGSSSVAKSPLEMQTSSALSANTTYGVYAQRSAGLASSFSILQLRKWKVCSICIKKVLRLSGNYIIQERYIMINTHNNTILIKTTRKTTLTGTNTFTSDFSDIISSNIGIDYFRKVDIRTGSSKIHTLI